MLFIREIAIDTDKVIINNLSNYGFTLIWRSHLIEVWK